MSAEPSRYNAEFACRSRIEQFFGQPADRDGASAGKARAMRELKAAIVEDLVQAHLCTLGLSDFFVSQALAGPPPSIQPLRQDHEASLFSENYLDLLVRQVILNQIERRIFEGLRPHIDRAVGVGRGGPIRLTGRFHPRTVSTVVALRMLNAMPELLATLAVDALNDLQPRHGDLIDFVEWSILAADHLFDPRAAREGIEWVAGNRAGGLLPLGADLELSNLPHGAGSPEGLPLPAGASPSAVSSGPNRFDSTYDSFRYFEDYGLDLLCWKLGGHVESRSGPAGRRGFLVFSLGAMGRRVELARPVTADPWLLNEFIGQVAAFYPVRPHSLGLSIFLPRRWDPAEPRAEARGQGGARGGLARGTRPARGSGVLPESVIRCLLAIAGDPGRDHDGRPCINRLTNREILGLVPTRRLDLLRIERRPRPHRLEELPVDPPDPRRRQQGQPVARYGLARLGCPPRQTDYQPLILALKGLQIHYRPGDMLTAKQMQAEPELEQLFRSILHWGHRPEAIGPADLTAFVDAVRAGLAVERLGRPAHSPAYLDWATGELERAIGQFNRSME